MDIGKLIVDYVGIWGALFVALFGAVAFCYRGLMESSDERRDFILGLTDDSLNQRYRCTVLACLDWVDHACAAWEVRTLKWTALEEISAAQTRNRHAFSYGLLDLAFLSAVVYPLSFLLLQWGWFGAPGRLGGLEVIPAEPNPLKRALAIGCLAISCIILWKLRSRQVLFSLKIQINPLLPNKNSLLTEFILVLFASSVALGVSVIGAGFGPVILACIVTAGVAYSGAFTITGTVSFGIAVLDSGAYKIPATFVGISAIVVLLGILKLMKRIPSRAATILVGYVTLLLLLLTLVVGLIHPTRDQDFSLLLFLGFFPVLNSLSDFVSTGATRAFLRKGMAGTAWQAPFLWSLIDLVVGLLAFFALGGALILSIQAVVWLGGPPMIDLHRIFANSAVTGSLLHDPMQYIWLYTTFLITLLPTFVHFVVAILSYVTTGPGFVRRWIAGLLEAGGQGRKGAGNLGLAALSTAIATAITGACALVWFGTLAVIWIFPNIGPNIVGAFAAWARLIGAI